jgi:hypothetical protein
MLKAIRSYLTTARVAALALGAACAALNAAAAYAASGITGAIIGLSAVTLPALADHAHRLGQGAKAVALWLAAIPCIVLAVANVGERTHAIRAGGDAERAAIHAAAERARGDLDAAKARLSTAEADARAARKLPRAPATKTAKAGTWCDDACLARFDGEVTTARTRVGEAETAVRSIEGKAVSEADLRAPVWLTGLAVDVIAFACLWFGFAPVTGRATSGASAATTAVAAPKRKRRTRSKAGKAKVARPAAEVVPIRLVANDNGRAAP